MNRDSDRETPSPSEVATPSKENLKENKKLLDKTLKNIDKELNSKERIGTRSQLDIEHKTLTFERKPRETMTDSKEIVNKINFSLEEAIKIIPKCKTEDDIYNFINACDLAVSAVEEKHVPFLIKYITTRITGKVSELIKYRDISKWAYVKKYLTDSFEAQHTASSLQVELNSVKQKYNESINDYNKRVENLYYKLCNASTIGKQRSDIQPICDTFKDLTLSAYITGLIKPIKLMVKARNPTTLELAKQIAKSEELEYKTEKEAYERLNKNKNNNYNNNYNNNFNNNNNYKRFNKQNSYQNNNGMVGRNNNINEYNKNIKRCFICNRANHLASECRTKSNNSYNNRPPNRNNFTRPVTNYNSRIKTCNFCKKNGHIESECYTKQNRNKRNNENNQNNSGNGSGSNVVRGAHSINQIIAAEPPINIASTSSQI
uniref:CCHC-type domain-containing protein n=1 Tax=Sipha flava TaxID=143950 RepID=A0A2S2Q6E7_9HEMI